MAELASVFQLVNYGIEGTAGQAGTATKTFAALAATPGINVDVKTYRPTGHLNPTVSVVGKEWSETDFSGPLTYGEAQFLLAGHYAKPSGGTPTIPTGGTNARYWLIGFSDTAAGTTATYTLDQGDATRAHRTVYNVIDAFNYDVSRDEIKVGAHAIGQKVTDNIVMAASPTALALQPVAPTEVTVYLDTASGSLGNTALTRLFSASYKSSGRYKPEWVVGTANASWVAPIDAAPSKSFTAMVEADANGMNLLGHLRGGTTLFVRVQGNGPTIEAGTINYLFRHDMALRLTDVAKWSDQDGVYAIEFTGVPVYDSGWGKAEQFELINTVTAL